MVSVGRPTLAVHQNSVCKLWVLYLAGSECVGGGVLEGSYVMCWYTCISAGVCIGCCV